MAFDDRIQFYDATSRANYYYFPSNFMGTGGIQCYETLIGNRVNYVPRSHAHGAKNIADGKLNGRMFTIKGWVKYDSMVDYRDAIDKMLYRCQRLNDNPGDYWLALPQFYDATAGDIPYSRVYYIDSLISFSVTDGEDGLSGQVEVVLGAGDPFGYKTREDTDISWHDADGTEKTITVSHAVVGYPQRTNPKLRITISSGSSGRLVRFDIYNSRVELETHDPLIFEFSPGISANGYIEIDFNEGSCVAAIDGDTAEFDAIKYLSNGNFYPILSGNNYLYFTGYRQDGWVSCAVQHTWRARWL